MRRHRLTSLLNTVRLDVLLGGVASCWLMVFLAFFIEPKQSRNQALSDLGLPLALLLTFIIITSLAIAGVALNNLLDLRYDQRFGYSRLRPPSLKKSLIGIFALLIGSAALSSTLGLSALIGVILIIWGIIFYNIAGRFMPAPAVITLAVIYGIIMTIPNFQLIFAWPIALVITHIMVCATIRMSMVGSKNKLHHLDVMWIILAWLFLMMLLLALMHSRNSNSAGLFTHKHLLWIGPFTGACLFPVAAYFSIKMHPFSRYIAAKRFVKVSNLWLIIYAAGWLFSLQLYWQGGVILLMLLVGAVTPFVINLLSNLPNSSTVCYKLDIDRPVKI